MSQFYQTTPGGAPMVPINFEIDVNDPTIPAAPASAGTVNAVANNLRVAGGNGIQTFKTSTAGDLVIGFIEGSGTTVGAVTASVQLQIPLNAVETYQVLVAGIADNNAGIGAYGSVVAKNIAATASIVGTATLSVHKDASLNNGNITLGVSGDNLVVTVKGVAGRTINWVVVFPGIAGAS